MSIEQACELSRAYLPYPNAQVDHAPGGPLSGLSFAVKDLFDVAGYPTGCGNPLMLAASGIKTRHANAVARVLQAGARFVGKVVTDEFAFSMTGQNAHFGAPRNPVTPDRITGGSSSGSASATAHGTCDFALGTDTGGSVRAPANHCGLWGMRPSHGRISLEGCMPLAPSLDTCGWFSTSATLLKRVGAVLLGDDQGSFPLGRRWLWPESLWQQVAQASVSALEPVARRWSRHAALACEVILDDGDAMYWAFRRVQAHESWASHGAFITRFQIPLGPGVAERFAWSATVTHEQHQDAARYRSRYCTMIDGLLQHDGVIVVPTMPGPAPLIAEGVSQAEDYRNRSLRLLSAAGLAGLPQITVPVVNGPPALGLSIIGPRGSDRALLDLALRLSNA